jgi:hypothetical protein
VNALLERVPGTVDGDTTNVGMRSSPPWPSSNVIMIVIVPRA